LPGVGKKKAAAIIEYRTKNGKFKSVNDLVNVKGVGKKMLAKLKDQIKTS
jgi:competence protein ComEA